MSARRASDSRAEGTSTWATATSGSGPPSVTISVAPRRTASGTNRRASCRSPGVATKQLPGSTRRESSVMDATEDGGAPTTVLTGSAASSSLTGISRAISFRRPWRQREPGGEARPQRLPRPGRLADDAALSPDLDRETERRERGERAPQRSSREIRHPAAPVGVDRRVGADKAHRRGHTGSGSLRRRPRDDLHGQDITRRHLEVAQDPAADRAPDRRGRLASPLLLPRLIEHHEHDEARLVRGRPADEGQHARRPRVASGRRIELLRGPRLARDLVPGNRRVVPGPGLDDPHEDSRQGAGRLGRDDFTDRRRREPPDLPPLGVEGRAHDPRLHERAAVGDGPKRRHQLERGHRDLLADRHRGQRQERPAPGSAQEPAALAGEPDTGRRPEAEGAHVAVVPLAPEGEAHLDGTHVRRVLQHLAERQPAVLLPVVDCRLGDGHGPVVAVDLVLGPDHALLERGRGEDDLEGRAGLEGIGHDAVAPVVLGRRLEKGVRVERRPEREGQHLTGARVEDDRHRRPGAGPPVGGVELALGHVLDRPVDREHDAVPGLRQLEQVWRGDLPAERVAPDDRLARGARTSPATAGGSFRRSQTNDRPLVRAARTSPGGRPRIGASRAVTRTGSPTLRGWMKSDSVGVDVASGAPWRSRIGPRWAWRTTVREYCRSASCASSARLTTWSHARRPVRPPNATANTAARIRTRARRSPGVTSLEPRCGPSAWPPGGSRRRRTRAPAAFDRAPAARARAAGRAPPPAPVSGGSPPRSRAGGRCPAPAPAGRAPRRAGTRAGPAAPACRRRSARRRRAAPRR